jgi:hypothetical protein
MSSSSIKIVKRKATGFFKKEYLDTIKQTVKDTNAIISNASILLRAYCLDCYEKERETIINTQTVAFACNIVQGVKKAPLRVKKDPNVEKQEKPIEEKKARLRKAKKVPIEEKQEKQDEPIEEKKVDPILQGKIDLFQDMLNVYNDIYNENKAVIIETKLSLSHILEYSIENLITAYETNIVQHFHKYPRRFIRCDLLAKNFSQHDANKWGSIITNHYMYDAPIYNIITGINILDYQHLFVEKQTVKDKPRCWDLKVNPWIYLPKMIQINRALEKEFPTVKEEYKQLYNPLPFHSSFVPIHIRIDTSGIAQLLMNKEKIADFKTLYELEHPGDNLNMSTKGDMLSSFSKLLNREPVNKEETGWFATNIWNFLTNLETCRQNKEVYKIDKKNVEWVFDNAIVTDGISISMQVIDRKAFGRKTLSGRKVKKENIEIIPEIINIDNYKVISCDPGKKDILAFSDGIDTITYTRGQRKKDTHVAIREKELLKRKRKEGIEDFESKVMNQYTKRSCYLDGFKNYAITRKSKEEDMIKFYSKPIHRQFRFLGYSTTQSSESKFADKTFKKFKDSNNKEKTCTTDKMVSNAMKTAETTKDILICWGDWGKKPNALKGSCSTPGIGIRRNFEGWFKTKTINEFLTSQTCPCCREERCLKKHSVNNVGIHHLLRCTNDNCKSRWWNRNVVGCFNIHHKALHPEIYETKKRTRKIKVLKNPIDEPMDSEAQHTNAYAVGF